MSSVADKAERQLRAWLENFVVGLNLCPFARPLVGDKALRISICEDTDPVELRRAFLEELDLLQRSSEAEIATTLLAFPLALVDYREYLQFLYQAEELLIESGLESVVQLASFHPQYRFEGEHDGAPGNYSNRAPCPLVHLLREDMLSRVLADGADPDEIPARNIRTLSDLGTAELERRWRALLSS